MSSIVYALKDPRDDAVRYVGVTSQMVKKRLKDH